MLRGLGSLGLGKVLTLLMVSLGAWSQEAQSAPRYSAYFTAELLPTAGVGLAKIRIKQKHQLVVNLSLRMPAERFSNIEADGTYERHGERISWDVPAQGGTLSYRYLIENKRDNGRFDAMLTPQGGLFRGDDLFPPAVVVTSDSARSRSSVQVTAPSGWSVETQYGNTAESPVRFFDKQRRFDRPTGWMLAGPLGIRRERIDKVNVSVAAVRGEGLRRQDILAFLHWNLPELIAAIGEFPRRLLITGADDPFWRGGLSGKQSLYMHSERPLIGEDGTSTLLHELVHVGTSLVAEQGSDWIVEGIAEFYSLEIMRRSGTISDRRFLSSMQALQERGRRAKSICTDRAAGDITARAVGLFFDLHRELVDFQDQQRSLEGSKMGKGQSTPVGLDAVVQELVRQEQEPVTLSRLNDVVLGQGLTKSSALHKMHKRHKCGETN